MNGAAAWVSAMQALALFAADPIGLGGIALRAGAGPVRDQWLTLLYQALPPGMPVRRLPLHVGDERMLGGLDLAATLGAGRLVEQKGLLAEADGGVVVLAMAERIDAGGAARLRAVVDAGVVTLQRDGLSRLLPARFAMVALDEGAGPDEHLLASLSDRMAFLVDLTDVALADMASIVTLAAAENKTITGIIDVPDATELLCGAAMALGIDSIRVPLFALRAARAAAALAGRSEMNSDDLALAAALVLAPRATRLPAPEQTEAEAEPEPEPEPPPETTDDKPESLPDQKLEDVVLEAALATLPPDLLAQLAQTDGGRGAARAPGRAGQAKMSVKRGRPIGTRQGEPKNGARLHLLETLKAAAPWQMLRRPSGSDRFQVRRDDFRIIRFRQRIGTTTVFAVDASGSSAMQRLGEAKGAVELLLADCYVRRDQVALLAFRGQGAQLLLPPTGSLLRAKRSLAGLPGGGPTPLAAGIDAALALADSIRRSGRTPVITLLTDARANIARDGSGGRPRAEAEAIESARALRASGVAVLLVDTSPRPNPFARRLAEEMRARYVPLPYADASALSQAVRTAAA
jgi:magnesium chelatase subunit D